MGRPILFSSRTLFIHIPVNKIKQAWKGNQNSGFDFPIEMQILIYEGMWLLKTGSHVLQRIPQMVTQINDRQVTSLSSGGEYNVAVDSDSQVWVWGRNEFGQVCSQNKPFVYWKPLNRYSVKQ